MATTWIKPLHTGKGRTIATALAEAVDYRYGDSKKLLSFYYGQYYVWFFC
jgi:hypothetical protein